MHGEGQGIFKVDDRSFGNGKQPFYQVLQLADITGPVVFAQNLDGLGRKPFSGFAGLLGLTCQEMFEQQRDVARALSQRGKH